MPRVLVVSNIPSPYNDALFRELARQPGVELLVAYGAATEPNRDWTFAQDRGYEQRVMRGVTLGQRGHLNLEIVGLLRRFAPDVTIVSGSYAMPTMQLAAAALTLSGLPWVYWGEALSHERLPPLQAMIRAALRRTIRSAYGVLAIGTRARVSYERIGIPGRRVADFRYYAENGHFRLGAPERASARREIRRRLDIHDESPTFLFCGQLIARKRLDTAIRALARVTDASAPSLIVAGDGPERGEFEALADSLGVGARVHFAGFVPYQELPRYFAAADALVLPSAQEGWGLVVPEALAAGLPVLASDRVNAAIDLVHDGEDGWVFPVGDDGALAARMSAIIASADGGQRLSANARAVAERQGPESAAPCLVRLLRRVLAGEDLHPADDGRPPREVS